MQKPTFLDELFHVLLQAIGLVPMHQPVRVRADVPRHVDSAPDLND